MANFCVHKNLLFYYCLLSLCIVTCKIYLVSSIVILFIVILSNMEKLSDNSHFITLQIDGQSPNLFSSNYITEAKKGHSITSPKQIMIQIHHP